MSTYDEKKPKFLSRLPSSTLTVLDGFHIILKANADVVLSRLIRDRNWEELLNEWVGYQGWADDLMSKITHLMQSELISPEEAEDALNFYLKEYRSAKDVIIDILAHGAEDTY